MAELRVGTSGWHYGHWRGVFYPPELRSGEWLSYYAGHFDTVEINNSFYQLPSREVFESWAREVPPGFLFAVKASRFITHMKKLKDPEGSLRLFMENSSALGGHRGPILFQLPPRWKVNPARLSEFISALPPGNRYAFEFRDPSWFCPEVYRILEEAGCALCAASSPSFPEVRRATAGFAFLRFHGGRILYGSKYSREELADWASYARRLLAEGRDVYAYFNNDAFGYAVEDAGLFLSLCRRKRRKP